MKRYAAIFSFLFLISKSVQAALIISTATNGLGTWSDSFSRSIYGDGWPVMRNSYYINMHPTNWWVIRDHSQSGQGNSNMLVIRFQKYGMPDWGYAATNGWNFWNFIHTSGNNPIGSNNIYGIFNLLVQAPWMTYATNGTSDVSYFTNDWPFAASTTNLIHPVLVADPSYYSANGNPAVQAYNLGARQVATQYGLPLITSFENLVNAETNWVSPTGTGYPANTNLFQDPPGYDHNSAVVQCAWAFTSVTNLAEETNCWTAVLDWSGAAVVSTQHCTIGSITKVGNAYTVTGFHADRMGPGYYITDGVQTNDCTGTFRISDTTHNNPLMPSITNMFFESTRFVNLPVGRYQVFEDGVHVADTTDAELQAGFNWQWRTTNGAWISQKTLGLELQSLLIGWDTNGVVSLGNVATKVYENACDTAWGGTISMASYIPAMQSAEAGLFPFDALINANNQQTNHTLGFVFLAPRYAGIHR